MVSQGLIKHIKNVHQKINNLLSPISSANEKIIAAELSFSSENDYQLNENEVQLMEEEQILEEAIEDQDLYDALDNLLTQANETNIYNI